MCNKICINKIGSYSLLLFAFYCNFFKKYICMSEDSLTPKLTYDFNYKFTYIE